MESEHPQDWDPKADETARDQEAAYDELRRSCPVAHSEFFGWSLFKHADILRVLRDHETFSNAVSQHLSVPNGMDPPEHTAFRKIIEPYFSDERMRHFEPVCRSLVDLLLGKLRKEPDVEFMSDAAMPFAVGVQCAFLGWPERLKEGLMQWVRKNQEATLARDRKALSEIAAEFELMIDELLEARRAAGAGPEQDLTASLMHERVHGRPLSNEELASILRNWTAGEIGTISAAAGILVRFLAEHIELQSKLRSDPSLLPYSIDEILRIHGPLVLNRRITTKPVEIRGVKFQAGERISLNWISADRDEAVFEDPESFKFGRDPAKNLLYGAGIHVCPGAPLARMELRIFMEELLRATKGFQVLGEPARAAYPASGFANLRVKLTF